MFVCSHVESVTVMLSFWNLMEQNKTKKINFTVLLCSSFSTCASLITKLLEDTATCHSHSTPTLPPDINFTFYCLIISNVNYLMVNINYKKECQIHIVIINFNLWILRLCTICFEIWPICPDLRGALYKSS